MAEQPPFLTADGPAVGQWFEVPTEDAWQAAATKILRGRGIASLDVDIGGGLHMPALSGATDAVLGAPDRAPFRRGARGASRRGSGWGIHGWIDAGSGEDALRQAQVDASAGASAVHLVPDGPGRGLPVGAGAAVTDADVAAIAGVVPVILDAGLTPLRWHRVAHPDVTLRCDPIGTAAVAGGSTGLDGVFAELAQVVSSGPVVGWSSLPWAEAGADPVLELALWLGSGAETLRRLHGQGVGVDAAAAALTIELSVGRSTFVEIAKLRAARWLASKLVAACGGPSDTAPPLTAVTARRELASRDPWVNLLRTSHGAFVAAVAGADAVVARPWDDPLGVPSDAARRVAITGQAVLAHEAHLAMVADPAGGSGTIEALTDALAREAWSRWQAIEGWGGLWTCLAEGMVGGWLADARGARRQALATGEASLLGVVDYPNPIEEIPARTTSWPVSGPSARGPWEPVPQVRSIRWSEPYEALRRAGEAADAAVLRVNLGPLAAHKARKDAIGRLLVAGGLRAVDHGGADGLQDALAAAGTTVVALAGNDASLDAVLPSMPPGTTVIAHRGPADHVLTPGIDRLALLTDLHRALGVSP